MKTYQKKKRLATQRMFNLHMRVNERECGECKECCTAVGVHELGKPYSAPCEHLCDKGCTIYESRPESCKVYHCFYRLPALTPDWGDDMRPDKLGAVLMMTQEGLEIVETRLGAFLDPKVWKAAFYIAEKTSPPFITWHLFDARGVTDFPVAKKYSSYTGKEPSLRCPYDYLKRLASQDKATIDDFIMKLTHSRRLRN